MAEIWQRTQKEWIKTLWKAYKPAAGAPAPSSNDVLWTRVSDMVGYFNGDLASSALAVGLDGRPRDLVPVGADCTLSPLRPTSASTAAEPGSSDDPSVRRVVCSPDLPVFSLTPTAAVATPATDTSTVGSSSTPESELAADSSTGPVVHRCTMCNKSFGAKSAFMNHMRTHGKVGEDPYQCNICGKTFAVPARLTRHNRTHTGEKPYQCEYCNKSFSVKENLSVHRRIHTKERPYKCDICDRAFEHSGKLHRHMRIHTGERPHKCSICSKTFIQSGQLVIHMRTHTGEKPYVCKICSKGFTCSKQLKVHNRTHTGEKPYSCDICGKSFGYNHVLKLHQVAHYGEKVYKCTICNHTFTSKKTMEMHIKSHAEPAPGAVNGDVSESCASSSSDKENKGDSDSELVRELALRAQPAPDDTRQEEEQYAMQPPPHEHEHEHELEHELEHEHEHEHMMQQPQEEEEAEHLQQLGEPHHPHPHQHQHPPAEQGECEEERTNMSDLCYYLYPRLERPVPTFQPMASNGVNPMLLAAAAAAAEREARGSPLGFEMDGRMSPIETRETVLPVTEPTVCVVPESLSRYLPLPPPPEYLKEPPEMMSHLPLSNPSSPRSPTSSPSPASSPDIIDLAMARGSMGMSEMNLPPRKRSKMILKSMETEPVMENPQWRYSSVIQFARKRK